MASAIPASAAVLLCLNVLFFATVSGFDATHRELTAGPMPAPPHSYCSISPLRLGVCASVLGGLIHVGIGSPSHGRCCPLIAGLADIAAAVCVCNAIKADILGVVIDILLSVTLLLNFCGKDVPQDFRCS